MPLLFPLPRGFCHLYLLAWLPCLVLGKAYLDHRSSLARCFSQLLGFECAHHSEVHAVETFDPHGHVHAIWRWSLWAVSGVLGWCLWRPGWCTCYFLLSDIPYHVRTEPPAWHASGWHGLYSCEPNKLLYFVSCSISGICCSNRNGLRY